MLFCSWPSYWHSRLTFDILHFQLWQRSDRKDIPDINITSVCLVLAALNKMWRPSESLKEIFDKEKKSEQKAECFDSDNK